ncbi:MAG: hypothetical protein Q9181_006896 [Wetmoreana brouardii]
MAPFFTNQSCDPFTPRSTPCTLGNYVNYAISVVEPSDIAKGIAFARIHNIRLVIRNTGHDYLGKSTGAGSLAIWTHHLKSLDFFDCDNSHYKGKAIRIGAGVQGIEAYEASQKVGLTVTSGECPTVGIAGGYTQGGGHSALASKYGLAADQTLEWELVTGTGEFLKASRTENSDLYWALSGGGGGTYGVVWSLTAKAHKDIPVSAANISWAKEGNDQETYYDAIAAYHSWLPAVVDAGAMSLAFGTNRTFVVGPITAPGVPVDELKAMMKPLTESLDKLKVNYTPPYFEQFAGYLPEFRAMMPPVMVAVGQYGGRLIPRSVVQNNPKGLMDAFKRITDDGVTMTTVGVNVDASVAGDVYNAVLPAWRSTLLDVVLQVDISPNASVSELYALQRKMTDKWVPQLEAISPGSGCYLNEGDFLQPSWQETFYGANYKRLRAIKAKYDPDDVFYATTAVGSDEWVVEASGKLCKV